MTLTSFFQSSPEIPEHEDGVDKRNQQEDDGNDS